MYEVIYKTCTTSAWYISCPMQLLKIKILCLSTQAIEIRETLLDSNLAIKIVVNIKGHLCTEGPFIPSSYTVKGDFMSLLCVH